MVRLDELSLRVTRTYPAGAGWFRSIASLLGWLPAPLLRGLRPGAGSQPSFNAGRNGCRAVNDQTHIVEVATLHLKAIDMVALPPDPHSRV
jgi:hypothetical protein